MNDLETRLRRDLDAVAGSSKPSPRLDRLIDAKLEAASGRRPVTRTVVLAAAALAFVAAVTVVVQDSNTPSKVSTNLPADGPVDDGLAAVLDDRVAVVAPSGAVQDKRIIGLPGAMTLGEAFITGQSLVVVKATAGQSAGTAYAVPATLDGPAVILGPAESAFAAAEPGRVWLTQRVGLADVARQVDTAGGMVGPAVTLPANATAQAAVGRLLVLASRRPTAAGVTTGLELFDIDTGQVRQSMPDGSRLVAVSGGSLAWAERGDSARLHVLDLASGRDRVASVPRGALRFMAGGRVSPDGKTLAALVLTKAGLQGQPSSAPIDAAASDVSRTGALVLIDLSSLTTRLIAGTEFDVGEEVGHVTWASDGDTVYLGQSGPDFVSYRISGQETGTVTVPQSCTCFQQVVAL